MILVDDRNRDPEAESFLVFARILLFEELVDHFNMRMAKDESLPEIVRALATPLSKIDKITVVSTGNGEAAGMHKITGDLTKMAAQVPALFEALSGMQMSELLSKVRQIGDKPSKPKTPELGA